MRHVATKIVGRLKHGLLSSVLDVWMCWVGDQRRLRHVLARMSVASLARAFGTWADAVRESQMSALRESSHEALQSANAAMEQLRTEMAMMAQEHAKALEESESSLSAAHSDALGSLRESLAAEHASAHD